MRTIRKRAVPNALTQWRNPRLTIHRSPGMDCTYQEMRRESSVLEAVEDGLFHEQGEICAYTGHRIRLMPGAADVSDQRIVDFHIEHLTPQAHCTYGQDADYTNMVACWPRPNCGFEPAYGARKKGAWPSLSEQAQFVSPLHPDCTARFAFGRRGEMSAVRQDDSAAQETIARLGLNHATLVDLRRAAIRGALAPGGQPIKLAAARKLLQRLIRDMDDINRDLLVQLAPFCFALVSPLEREIRKLEAIVERL